MSVDGHRIIGNGEDWVRSQERRMIRQERRPAPPNLMDYFGPGITQNARQIADWNDVVALSNGWYFTEELGINSPDPMKKWIGQTITSPGGIGVQSVFSHTGTGSSLNYTRQFTFPAGSITPVFTAWTPASTNTVPTLQVLQRLYTFNGGGITASNSGVFVVRYTWNVAKATGAQEWRMTFFTNAQSTVNAAGNWQQRFIDHTGTITVLQEQRVHNHGRATQNLGVSFSNVLDVRSIPAGALCGMEVWLSVDAGGGTFDLTPGNFGLAQVTY